MNKFVLFLSVLVIQLCIVSAVFAQDINVNVNGSYVDFNNSSPVIESGRVLIPLRGVFERMGYSVEWISSAKTAVLENIDKSISLKAGDTTIYVNGSGSAMDVPARIIGGSMYIPLRAVGEASGASVNWDSETKTAYITWTRDTVRDGGIDVYLSIRGNAIEKIDFIDFLTKIYPITSENIAEQSAEVCEDAKNTESRIASAQYTIGSLLVPPGLEQVHSITLQSLEKQQQLCRLIVDVAEKNISVSDAETQLNELTAEAERINAELKTVLSSIDIY